MKLINKIIYLGLFLAILLLNPVPVHAIVGIWGRVTWCGTNIGLNGVAVRFRQLTTNTDPNYGKQPRDFSVLTTDGPLAYMLYGCPGNTDYTPLGAGWYALLGGPAECFVPGLDCGGGPGGYYDTIVGPAYPVNQSLWPPEVPRNGYFTPVSGFDMGETFPNNEAFNYNFCWQATVIPTPSPSPTPSPTPIPLRCNSLTVLPNQMTVITGGETRVLTANSTGGSGTVTYAWTISSTGADKGSLSATTGQTVTWTAPAVLPSTSQSWTVTATATDSIGNTSMDSCTTTFSYTPVPQQLAVCDQMTATPSSGTIPLTVMAAITGHTENGGAITQYKFDFGEGLPVTQMANILSHTYNSAGTYNLKGYVIDDKGNTSGGTGSCLASVTTSADAFCGEIIADKDYAAVKVGDVINFTGYGWVTDANDSIDLINFIITKNGIEDQNVITPAVRAPEKDITGRFYYKATVSYTVSFPAIYATKIRVHWVGGNVWKE